ncbi:MAG: DUF433 domain-containing protein [Desulfurococcales archaeon]|nr:DUF433 domain-containing protein [Desulfurococcales archaeon]
MERRFKWIIIDPNVCHGKPVFRGTRVLVADVLDMIASGMSIDEILEEYPQLNREMILEAIALAAELLRRERRVIPIPA